MPKEAGISLKRNVFIGLAFVLRPSVNGTPVPMTIISSAAVPLNSIFVPAFFLFSSRVLRTLRTSTFERTEFIRALLVINGVRQHFG